MRVRSQAAGTGTVAIDFSDVTRFDTMGALVLSQFRGDLEELGAKVSIKGESEEQATLCVKLPAARSSSRRRCTGRVS